MQDNAKLTKSGRRDRFKAWWKRNENNLRAHKWLVKHSKRCIHDYSVHPEAFTVVTAIAKRYHLSTYKRLNKPNAWTLWKISHPLHNERIERVLATGAFLREKQDELAAESKSLKTKSKVEELSRNLKARALAEETFQTLTDPAEMLRKIRDNKTKKDILNKPMHQFTNEELVEVLDDYTDMLIDAIGERIEWSGTHPEYADHPAEAHYYYATCDRGNMVHRIQQKLLTMIRNNALIESCKPKEE